jgi:hypothetical protein
MIRLAHAQHGNAKAVEQRAKSVVSNAVGVPVRQNNHGTVALSRKPARIHQIIFRIRRPHRRGEAQKHAFTFGLLLVAIAAGGKKFNLALLQAEVGGRLVREELITSRDDAVVQPMKVIFIFSFSGGTISIYQRPALCPFHAPFQRAHHAVGISRGETGLP